MARLITSLSDNGSVHPSPAEEYKQRLQSREQRVAHFERQHIRIGNIRLLMVVATLLLAWFVFDHATLSPWWLLVSLGAFIGLVAYHAKVLRRKVCAERAVAFYRPRRAPAPLGRVAQPAQAANHPLDSPPPQPGDGGSSNFLGKHRPQSPILRSGNRRRPHLPRSSQTSE